MDIIFDNNYTINEKGDIFNKKKGIFNKGTIMNKGYRHIRIKNKKYLLHRLLYQHFINPYMCPMPRFIDHADNNRLNNSLDNLRPATNQQNMRNKKNMSNNILGIKGIRMTANGNYQSRIMITITEQLNRTFKTLEEAIAWREEQVILYHGEFGRN
jgi:hypothetical protein